MDWTEIVVAVIAALGGFIGAVVSNNKRLSVFEAVVLNERITRLEVMMEERK